MILVALQKDALTFLCLIGDLGSGGLIKTVLSAMDYTSITGSAYFKSLQSCDAKENLFVTFPSSMHMLPLSRDISLWQKYIYKKTSLKLFIGFAISTAVLGVQQRIVFPLSCAAPVRDWFF